MKIFYDRVFKNYFLMMMTIFLGEIIFRLVVGQSLFSWAVIRIFFGVNVICLFFGGLYSLFGNLVGNILSYITALFFNIYAIVQAGFLNYLGVYVSFGNTSQAGAVKDYIRDYVDSFSWKLWLVLIPNVLMLLFYLIFEKHIKILESNDSIDFSDKFDSEERKKDNQIEKAKRAKSSLLGSRIAAIVFMIVFSAGYYATLVVPFMQNSYQLKSNKNLFLNPDIPNIAVGQFGYSGYLFADLRSLVMPVNTNEVVFLENKKKKKEEEPTDYTRYIDDTYFKMAVEKEGNKNYKSLGNYFLSKDITSKNGYTEMFKDKNLIVIMMESTNNIVINEEYFPNLYKLYSEGWSWSNAYSPRNSCSTGNNETSGMTSLYTINNFCTANAYKNNIYPQAIFNIFNNAGYTTSSYHNYTDHYYARTVFHKNMGSGHFYSVEELGIPYSNEYKEWPSDVSLVEKVLELTENQEKYMVWMTSVTAHQPYTQSSTYGDKFLDLFANTKYDITLKRYLSKLKEFDLAIEKLVEGLKEQGKFDDTVIVLYGDHYPYGLKTPVINTYLSYDVTKNLDIDKTPFIIYNSKITPTKYEQYTSYINIVPTIANLFGLEYDPRLYFGNDILSEDYEDRVIFADGSWQDKKAFYSATTGKVIYESENDTYTVEEIKDINNQVKMRISMSNLAIKTDYFNYLNKKIEEYKQKEQKEES